MCGEPTQEQDDPVEVALKAFAPQGDERQKSVRIAMERLAQEVKACQKKGRSSLGKKVFLKRAYKKVTHEDGKACIKLSVEAWNPFRTRVRSAELTFRTGDNFNFDLRVGKLIRYTPTGDKEKDVQAVTQMCISALEKLIREDPIQWLWAPRHWLDINRRQAPLYKDWKPPVQP